MEPVLPAVFTLDQARALGVTPAQVKYRCRMGRWRKVLGDAWTAENCPVNLDARAVAAQLTWPDAIIAGRTAAILHGFPLEDDGLIHMFAPSKRHPRDGILKRIVVLDPEDVMTAGDIRLTTPGRTALDCLARLEPRDGLKVLAWAVTRQFVSHESALAFACDRHGLAGNRQLRAYLRFLSTNAASHAEVRFHRMLQRANITGWRANAPIRDGARIVCSADVLFEGLWLIFEIDGAAAHLEPEADARRDALTLSLGFRTVRITAGQLYRKPREVLALVRAEIRAAERFGRRIEPRVRPNLSLARIPGAS